MRTKLFALSFVLTLLISLTFIFTGCKKDQEAETEQFQEQSETEMSLTEKLEQDVQAVIKPLDSKGAELKKELDEMLSKIKNYEQTLLDKGRELSMLADTLNAREQGLIEKESSLKSYRTASWVIFWIGLVLFIVGLVLFLLARKTTSSDKAEKAQKKITKAAEKEEKKTEKNLKKDTPPKE